MEGTKSWNDAEMMSRVHIGNTARLEKEDLRQAFEQFGTVTNVWIARNPPGFAFVTFSTPEEAEKAIREGNNMEIRDDRVSVELAHPRVGEARLPSCLEKQQPPLPKPFLEPLSQLQSSPSSSPWLSLPFPLAIAISKKSSLQLPLFFAFSLPKTQVLLSRPFVSLPHSLAYSFPFSLG